MDPQYIVFGLVVGVLVGLTGIGGGSLMTPLLILGGGVPPTVAIGTDLAYGAVTKTVGGWRHLRIGTVDLGVSKWLAFGSVPGSLVGVWAVNHLHSRHGDDFDGVLLAGVAGALLVVAGAILYRVLFMPGAAERERHSVEITRRVRIQAVTIGAVMGAILGMTSVGSGALIGLALILIFRLTPHRVVGTDVFHAAILLWTAALAHGAAGNVDLVIAGTLLLGSVPGVWIGTMLLPKIPAHGLRPVLACVLLASALAVLSKAGVDLPAWVIVAVPACAGLVALLVHRRRSRPEVVPA
ncbi:MAG: sulfite exporter TauE/SafE family protein [Solirubrobacteraceae bacterium]|nr:sulfite exporter TauE/SafE family protein [Solirubrobacteraceae bacterium]